MFVAVLAIPIVGPLVAKAAADTVLTTNLASGTEYMTDNKANIGNYTWGVGLVIVGITVGLAALYWMRRQGKGIFGGKTRRS